MPKIIYYVASSLDGYIAGENNDISTFVASGNGVKKYLSDLQEFSTVIMGRRTYEFSYQFGLKPGEPAYPHMEHHIFSNSLVIDKLADNVHLEKISVSRIKEIRDNSPTDVYLCGGGQFAGWLLDNKLIDQLKLKLNPIVLGNGVSLFGDSNSSFSAKLIQKEFFDEGLVMLTYEINH